MADAEPHAWEAGRMISITYVGLDVHEATMAVSERCACAALGTTARRSARFRWAGTTRSG